MSSVSALSLLAAASIWIEGEQPITSTFNQHSWYSAVQKDQLSPGAPGASDGSWLAHFANNSSPVQATWSFQADSAGTYQLWLRVGTYRVSQWVQLDSGPRIFLDLDHAVREEINLVYPSLDVRFMGWILAGEVQLSSGAHTLTSGLEPHPDWNGTEIYGGVDVIHLTPDTAWAPAGALAPQRLPAAAPETWFAYTPGDPPSTTGRGQSVFGTDALVEKPAGARGPVQRLGAELLFEDGTPLKLWGINAAPAGSAPLREQQAAFYASLGINLVRFHPVESFLGLPVQASAGAPLSFDATALDAFDHYFSVLKQQGIYMDWSVFYPHVITEAEGYALYAELPSTTGGRSTSGLVTFVPELQASEWRYLEALLSHKNPYTGLTYREDPALALVEIRNEDSVFWHAPLNTLAEGVQWPQHTALLKRLWSEWLAAHYTDDSALLAAWGPVGHGSRASDSLANPAPEIYGAWEMQADGPYFNKEEAPRLGDFIRFLAETQRSGYRARYDELRTLGYSGLIVSTAWMAGGPAASAANLFSDTAADVIDRHAYLCGSAGSWRIEPGVVDQSSHLTRLGEGILASAFYQVEEMPFMLSEWSQCPPNPYTAEILPLVALFGLGLQGWDISLHFTGSKPWLRGGWPDLVKFASETPHYLGQFPALAHAVHGGHIREAPLAAARRLSADEVFSGVDPFTQPLPEGGWEDEATLNIPSWVVGLGRISASFEGESLPSERTDWSALGSELTTESLTGELHWEADPAGGPGVVTVSAEKTQAIIGAAGGKTYHLPAFDVTVTTPFVSLLFTSLDDRPLLESGHVLVTAMARATQLGALYSEDGTSLVDPGGPPLLLEPVQAQLTFLGPALTAAYPLDPYGVPRDLPLERSGNRVVLDGRWQATAYELLAAEPENFPSPMPEEAGGCACSDAPASPAGPGVGWLLALLPLWLRRTARVSGGSAPLEAAGGVSRRTPRPPPPRAPLSLAFAPGLCMLVITGLTACAEDPIVRLYPRLQTFPEQLDLGEVPVGTSVSAELSIQNPGQATLELQPLVTEGDTLTLSDLPADLPAGESARVSLTFAPQREGTHSGAILVNQAEPGALQASILWRAEGTLPSVELSPSTLDFGTPQLGESVSLVAVLANQGRAPLSVTGVELEGLQAGAFSYALFSRTLPFVLPPGGSEVVTLTFTPLSSSPCRAKVRVTTSDPKTPSSEVVLLGNQTPTNSRPAVQILTPGDGDHVSLNQHYVIRAWALDAETDPEALSVVIRSLRYGELAVLQPDSSGEILLDALGLIVGEDLLTITVTDPEGLSSSDQVAIFVEACAELSWRRDEHFDAAFDFTLFAFNGDAYLDEENEEVVLTPSDYNKAGAVFIQQPILLERFRARIELRIDPATGADGIAIAWVGGASVEDLLGQTGGYMGVGNHPDMTGYVVELDDWFNSAYGDIEDDHVGVLSLPEYLHGEDPIAVPEVEDGLPHSLAVDFNLGVLEVAFDGRTILQTEIPDYLPFEGYLGVTGATGASYNLHTITRWEVETGCW